MNNQIGKGVYLVSSAVSFLYATWVGLHIVSFPNEGHPDLED